MKTQLWSLRQNPYANTNQKQMRQAITDKKFVSCPFGHVSTCRNNVLDGVYNIDANQQDIHFIEDIKIGDLVLIPFTGQKSSILAKILTDPIYCVETGLYTNQQLDNQITISETSGEPFRPVGRMIEIIDDNVIFSDKRKYIPMNTLKRISLKILEERI
jgi:hypothetical protein